MQNRLLFLLMAAGSLPAAHAETPGHVELLRATCASGDVTKTASNGAIRPDAGVPVTAQTFAPYAGSGAWLLTPGVAMRVRFELPAGAQRATLEIDELGWLDAPAGATYDVLVDGRKTEVEALASRVFATRTIDVDLAPGEHELLLANNTPGARIGIVAVTIAYRRTAPTGEGQVRSVKGEAANVEMTLIGPTPGQRFDLTRGIPIEWDSRGFSEGAGIAIHWRRPGSPWNEIAEARGLPFNYPSGKGTRGRFLWKPKAAMDGVEFGLSYVARGRRDPMRIQVGGEDGLSTIAEAMDQARDGDTIVLAPGSYQESFVVPVSLSIVGADRERVTISSDALLSAITVPKDVNLKIRHLTVDCAPALRKRHVVSAFDVEGSLDLTQVRIRSASSGVKVRGGAVRADQVQIERVVTGLELLGGRMGGRSLRVQCDSVAARVEAGASLTLQDSRLACKGTGILARGPKSAVSLGAVTVAGSKGSSATDRGAAAYSGATVQLNRCEISNFHGAGLWVEGKGSRLEARDTQVFDQVLNGVCATKQGTMDLKACTIRSNGQTGIVFQGAFPSSLTDCKVTHNKGWAGTIRESHGSKFIGTFMTGNQNNTLWVDAPNRSTRRGTVIR